MDVAKGAAKHGKARSTSLQIFTEAASARERGGERVVLGRFFFGRTFDSAHLEKLRALDTPWNGTNGRPPHATRPCKAMSWRRTGLPTLVLVRHV